MTMRQPEFAGMIAQRVQQFRNSGYASVNAECAAIATALSTDVTTHSRAIDIPPAALNIHHFQQTPFTNDINIIVNKGKAGNLSTSQMIAGIDQAVGVAFKPAVVDIPYASANASPPVVGTVCSCTNGNWVGSPTGYTYQWTRDGTNIGAATAATYTLVSADTGGHKIQCRVTATNVTGSTAAPLSNGIQVP